MENKFYLFSSKLSPEIGGIKTVPHPQASFPRRSFGRVRAKASGEGLIGWQSWLLSERGPACVVLKVFSCPKAADPKMSTWGRPGLFCFTSWWSVAEGLCLLMDMEQGSFWDLHVTAPGCARNGSGSPWARNTGEGAFSGGTQGIMQNSSEKSRLLHQVRRDEQWKRICSWETGSYFQKDLSENTFPNWQLSRKDSDIHTQENTDSENVVLDQSSVKHIP